MKRNQSLVYIGLSLGITWLLWIPALLWATDQGYSLPTIDILVQQRTFQFANAQHVLAVILFSLAVYGPLVGALAAAWMEGGRPRVREWFAPVLRWAIAPRWLAWLLLIPLALVLVPVGVGWLTGLVTPRAGYVWPSALFILFLFLYQLVTSGLGEEPGWRGYLMPLWQAQHGREKAIWGVGVVWAVWHFPFTIYFTLQGASGMPLAAQLSMLVPALIGQTMSLIGMTYIYAWLLDRTKSVFSAMLLHALGNTLNAVILAAFIANPIIGLAIAAMPWLVVFVLEQVDKRAAGRSAVGAN